MKAAVFAGLALAGAALGAPTPRRVMHTRTLHPHDWTRVGPAHPDAAVRFHLAVTQQNTDAIVKELMAVSNPDSPRYGQWLTTEQAAATVAPPAEHVQQVHDWVTSFGALALARSDDVMGVASVKVVEEMFETKMYTFEHNESKARIVAHMGASSVPHRIGELIDFVSGLSLFTPQKPGPKRHSQFKRASVGDGPDYATVPATLNKLYDIPSAASHNPNKNSAGVIEFSPQGAGVLDSDMSKFASECGGLNTPVFKKVGPWNTEAQVDVEATLDLEYIASTANGAADLWFWTGTSWLYEFAQDFIKAGSAVPSVISISYGWAESAQCQISEECNQLGIDSAQYVARVNTEFAKISATGISIIVASGDAGAASKLNTQCNQTPKSPINPDYPASSPFITAVGATMMEGESKLQNAPAACEQQGGCSDGTGSEVVCSVPQSMITSGGGFSNYASVSDSRQQAAIDAWLSNPNNQAPPSHLFNRKGRAYPDITVSGHKYIIVDNGQPEAVDGTSCSAPVFAGMVARLNEIRLSAGKPVLGLVNSLLFKLLAEQPHVFTDITKGNNRGTEGGFGPGAICEYGFSATVGYDPVSGVGSPVFSELAKAVAALP